MKKKILVLSAVFVLLIGSAQVFAATVLNTNLIDLINNGFNAIKANYSTKVEADESALNEKYTNETTKAVDNITQDALNKLEEHKNNEIARSEQELKAYLDAVTQELSGLAGQQVNQIKDSITQNVNSSIQKTKEQIDKEIEKQIMEKLK